MFGQKIGAAVGAVVVCVLVGAAGAFSASADELSGDCCREDCQRSKDERDAICGGLPTEEARKTCLASSAKLYEPCRRECVRKNDDLRECLDECEYRKGREDEACARKRDPIERKQCFAEAMRKYVECKRECEKKHKPKE